MSCDQSHVNSFDKLGLKNVRQDFMNNESVLIEIKKRIDTLEKNSIDTPKVDDVYTNWCNIVKDNMYDNIPYITLRTRSSNTSNFKKFGGNKPWWNDSLSKVWSYLCAAEAEWLRCVTEVGRTFQNQPMLGVERFLTEKLKNVKDSIGFRSKITF